MQDILVKANRCLACKQCEIACVVEHAPSKNLLEALKEKDKIRPRVRVEQGEEGHAALQCFQCEDATCVGACIAGALSYDETGIIVHEQDKCVGCWICVLVCPYGVMRRNQKQQTVLKCDRCLDSDYLACVEACPVEALVVRERDAD